MNRPIRIATLYRREYFSHFSPNDMSTIRWLRISEGLADLGYEVDMIINSSDKTNQKNPNLKFIPYSRFNWRKYDVVKTLFHRGFESLRHMEGEDHPFIISKLGSVVGNHDNTEGVHFFNEEREDLYRIQKQINAKSKYISILTKPSKILWENEFDRNENLLIVPTGVDKNIPPPTNNPYKDFNEKIAVYIGNIYGEAQKEMNLLWQERLNILGNLLRKNGIRLCFIGMGDVEYLNHKYVTYFDPVGIDKIWDFHYFADVGIALAQGKVQHNESSKMYYYLRTGLPVVSEAPIPNNSLIKKTNLGFIADYNDNQMIANLAEAAIHKTWEKEESKKYMLKNHTWNRRVRIYDKIIRTELSLS